jgi:hypothetical protein
MRLDVVLIALVLSILTPNLLLAQTSADQAERIAAAKNLIKASNAVEGMVAAMRANLPVQRQAMPQIPEEFWTRFEARMVKEAPTLGDSIAVLYARTFSLRELQEVTAFFASPIGRRFVEVQPLLVAESSALGQRWGARLGDQIAKELIR